MVPDYLTFIRFQDKRNLFFIYLVTTILLGFYWKNANFSFSYNDVWVVSCILALIFYSFIVDLKAYWAYKCVVKNVDFSFFINKSNNKVEVILFRPIVAGGISCVIFGVLSKLLFLFIDADYMLLFLVMIAPLVTWNMFNIVRNGYIKQVAISVVDRVKYKRLSHYLLRTVAICTVMNLLTLSPLRESEKFDLSGRYFTLESIITMWMLCLVVLIVNLFFLRFSKRYVFLGHIFLKEIDLLFSSRIPLYNLYVKPLWLRLAVLFLAQFFWISMLGGIMKLMDAKVSIEIYFLLCYTPCLFYYALHTWWQWHNDYMMSCDMYLRWGQISKQTTPWLRG